MGDSIRTMELHKSKFDNTTVNAVLQKVAYGLQATYHSSLTASTGQLIFERDVIIKAVNLANWSDVATRRRNQIRINNASEHKYHIPHDYIIGESGYIRNSCIKQSKTLCRVHM
jgi:hypothetical protein